MKIPERISTELVPSGYPDPPLIHRDTLQRADGFPDDVRRRAYLWAMAILGTVGRALPPRTQHLSAGFVHVDRETNIPPALQPTNSSWVFGAYALVAGDSRLQQRVELFTVGNRIFPLVTTFGEIRLHGPPPNASPDSSACWVRNTGNYAPWTHGILTCRHVLPSLARGVPISLSPTPSHATPTAGVVGDVDECTIDAAVVQIDPADWPGTLSPLAVGPVAPSLTFSCAGRTSSQTGTVLRIFQDPTYHGNLLGERVITDTPGVRGDSGALVTNKVTGDGIAVYMGNIPDGAGGFDGINQDLMQATVNFAFSCYF